nr:uncharacterized protein LOC112281948 isoform X3 [Physcomitrium patens]|eukprot:XP_024374788.1 uncharacterized protein LOC112281948 isoform X3 [Physcomitrella patens]
MGNALGGTAQVLASEYYLHDLVASYSSVSKRSLVGGRVRHISPVPGTLSSCCKLNGTVGGGDENLAVESTGVITIKTGATVAVAKILNERQEEAMREALAVFMDNNHNPKVPNHLRVKKVRFREQFLEDKGEMKHRDDMEDRSVKSIEIPGRKKGVESEVERRGKHVRSAEVLQGGTGQELGENAGNLQGKKGARNQYAVSKTGGYDRENVDATGVASQISFGRSKFKRDVGEYSAQEIIERAESLILDTSVDDQRDASIAMNLLEKKWLKLFSSAQQVKSTGSDRVKLVLQLLDMMYESEIRMNAIHVCVAVTVCVNEKALDIAKKVIDRARSYNRALVNVFVYAKLLQGYCSSNQRKEAFALLTKLDAEGLKHDVVMYNTLIETEQSPEGVEILWRELEIRGIQPNERTYCGAIRCYGRAGQLGAVRRLWHEMTTKNVSFTMFTFNSLLDAYANVGDVDACKIIINEMESQKLKPSRDSYNTLLKAHARCRDSDGAVGVLRNMQRRGIKPCIITYNTAMDACIRGRDMLRAIGLAKELPLHQLKPDETTSATLLRSAGLLRDTALVRKVLQDMVYSGCSHDETTYRCAVYAYVHCGEGGLALEMLEKMTTAGFPPAMTVSEVLVKSVDAALLRECTAAAPAGKLNQFLAAMAAAGLSPTRATAGAMVRKLAHTPGVDVALDVADELRRGGINGLGLHTWQSVIAVSVRRVEQNPAQASAEVIRILDAMESDGTVPDRVIYESALSVFVKCGDGGRAINLYEKMRLANLSPSAKEDGKDPLKRMLLDTMDAALLGALIAGLEATRVDGVQGDKSAVHSSLTSTASIVQDLADAGIRVKPGAMTKAIRQLCADVHTPVQTLEDTKALAVRKPTGGRPPRQINVEGLAQAERFQRLERAIQSVEASNCLATSFVYGALMEACIRLQKGERVETLWHRMRLAGVTPDLRTWVLRVQALASAGNFQGRTSELLNEAAKDQFEHHSVLLRAMLKACHQVKDMAGVAHVKRILNSKRLSQSISSTDFTTIDDPAQD